MDLRQRNGKGRVRSGLIDDAVHERAEVTGGKRWLLWL
jgi:hypothetical protein